MKKRPSFKVAAIESLETRELLSTTAFRPIQLRASHLPTVTTTAQSVTVNPSSGSGHAIHVQGGPSATFNVSKRTQVLQTNPTAGRNAYSALLQNPITRRAQRSSPIVATTPAAPTTPTKLAPGLPFTPPSLGNSQAAKPAFSMNQGSTSRTSPFGLTTSPVVASSTASNTLSIQKISGSASTASTAAATSSAVSASPTTLVASTLASYKLAVDNFATSYSSGVDKTRDVTALSALNASLALLGTNSWPINPTITTTSVSGFQTSVNTFAQTFTGGANPTADTAAWNGLSTAFGPFATASTTTAVATATATTTSTTSSNVVSPVINGLISGIVSTGTLSTDSLAAFRNAIDNFAASYTSGTNTSADKVATINLVTSLNSVAMTQWNKVAVTPASTSATTSPTATTTAAAVTTTPVTSTTTATAVATPTTTAPTPTAVSAPTPVTVTSTSATSTTASNTTSSKAGMLFTAIRAPGV